MNEPTLYRRELVQQATNGNGVASVWRYVPVEPDKNRNPYRGHYETAGLEQAWDAGFDAALGIGGDE